MVLELKDHPYEVRLRALKLPSLFHRRRRDDMIYMYKISTNKMNIHKGDFFQMSHLRTQGHQFKSTDKMNIHKGDCFQMSHLRTRGHQFKSTDTMNIHKGDFFQMSHLRTRGHQFKSFKEHAKKLTRINTFSRRIVNDWNVLSPDIVNAPSIISFKSKLDEHWRDKINDISF